MESEAHQLLAVHQVDKETNKTKIKKAITQPFPESQILIIQSTQKSQKLHSTAANKNSQVTMLMLKLDAKSSTFVLSTTLVNLISSAQMELFS